MKTFLEWSGDETKGKEEHSIPKASKKFGKAQTQKEIGNKKIEEVPIKQITSATHQPHIYTKIKEKYKKQIVNQGKHVTFKKHPIIFHYKGEYGLEDGHHKVQAAIEHGATHITSHVIQYKD